MINGMMGIRTILPSTSFIPSCGDKESNQTLLYFFSKSVFKYFYSSFSRIRNDILFFLFYPDQLFASGDIFNKGLDPLAFSGVPVSLPAQA